MINQEENIKRVKNHIEQFIATSSKSAFVIIDGDRTLIPADSTKYFFTHLNLNYADIKSIFKKHGYCFTAFNEVARYYSKIELGKYDVACEASAKLVNIYPEFLSFIKSVQEQAELILITSGIKQSWQNVINNHSIEFMHLIGGNYFPSDNFIVDKEAKGIIARSIKEANKKVYAFGDTMIDFEMLREAHNPFLVVNEKLNTDFIPNANQIPHLKQISFSEYYHPNIPKANLDLIKKQILE